MDDPLEALLFEKGGTRLGLIDFDGQTRAALFESIARGRAAGFGGVALARSIELDIARGPWSSSRVRAEVIARTESKWAQNTSALEIYNKAESVTHVQVYDAQAGNCCDVCEDMDGNIYTVQEAMSIEPLEHPNCTRAFAPLRGAP
jgi:SPP1 gp7 family putative phage head morphogenesis protein